MARRQVLELVCDRCGKTETQELSSQPKSEGSKELEIKFHGETMSFEDLCHRCRRACVNYIKQLKMETEEKKTESVDSSPPPVEEKRSLFGKKAS